MTIAKPELDLVVQLFRVVLPDLDFLLRKFESDKKWIRFSPRLHQLTTQLNCQNYPELYQDEARILSALLRAMFASDQEGNQFLLDITARSLDEQYQFFNDIIRNAIDLNRWLDTNLLHLDDLDWSPATQARERLQWEKLPQEEQQQRLRFHQYSLMFILASFFNYMALMVHGRKLTQLVREAMAGNDDSFCLAIHIDKNILFQIPYFKDRYLIAQQEGDEAFLKAVSYRLHLPPLNGKIRHRLLFMLFAFLESTQWLDSLKHREILDICDALNLNRYENLIETENALTKRLRDYRMFQQSNSMSMP